MLLVITCCINYLHTYLLKGKTFWLLNAWISDVVHWRLVIADSAAFTILHQHLYSDCVLSYCLNVTYTIFTLIIFSRIFYCVINNIHFQSCIFYYLISQIFSMPSVSGCYTPDLHWALSLHHTGDQFPMPLVACFLQSLKN